MAIEPKEASALRVASLAVVRVALGEIVSGEAGSCSTWSCEIEARGKLGQAVKVQGRAATRELAIADAVSGFCTKPIRVFYSNSIANKDSTFQSIVAVEDSSNAERAAVGRLITGDEATGLVVAALRAANNAGLLTDNYRANNQILLRDCAKSLMGPTFNLRHRLNR